MEEKEIKNLVKTWYGKSKFEQNPFSKFVFLWICFNAWISYKSDKPRDSDMIKWLIRQDALTSDLISSYENSKETEPFIRNLKTLANMPPIHDSRDGRKPIIIKDENDFRNIVKGIYRIRCNLFHGSKQYDNSRNLKLVMISYRILEKWIGNMICDWNLDQRSKSEHE